MFFRLTNSLAIFQTIINKILWDLINTREVISFIDNFIVETEEEKKIKGVLDQLTPKKVKNIQKFLRLVSGTVHTRVEVHRMDSEMSGLVE